MENMHTDVRVERVMVQGLQQSSCRKLRLEFSLFFNGIALSSYVGKKLSVNCFHCRLHQRKDFLPKEELFIR